MQTYADGHLHPVRAVATNSSSTVLLSASDKTVLATDLVTAQCRQKWWGHVARVEHVSCLGGGGSGASGSAGEEVYASASYDGTTRLWDARSRSREPLMVLDEAKDAVTCVERGGGRDGDGGVAQIVTSSVDGKVRLPALDYLEVCMFCTHHWIDSRCCRVDIPNHIPHQHLSFPLNISQKIKRTSSIEKIRTYDLRTAQLITEDVVHPVTSFAISTDGRSIAASCLDGIIRSWDTTPNNEKKRVRRKFHSSHVCGNYKVECTYTSNDKYLVCGSEDGAVAVYRNSNNDRIFNDNVNGNNQVFKANGGTKLERHTAATCSVAACPQETRPWLIVSASYDGSAVVWSSQANYDCMLD